MLNIKMLSLNCLNLHKLGQPTMLNLCIFRIYGSCKVGKITLLKKFLEQKDNYLYLHQFKKILVKKRLKN